MPPKPKFTKEEIVQTALEVVAEKGADRLTARELGDALGSSARPIFTVFRNMEEVQAEVRKAAMRRFESYAEQMLPGMPRFKQIGMQMVLFGVREPKLYQLLFMQENENAVTFDDIYGELGVTAGICIEAIRRDYGLDAAESRTLFENVWIYTFGVGALCATGMCRFPEEKLGEMLSDQFRARLLAIQNEAKP